MPSCETETNRIQRLSLIPVPSDVSKDYRGITVGRADSLDRGAGTSAPAVHSSANVHSQTKRSLAPPRHVIGVLGFYGCGRPALAQGRCPPYSSLLLDPCSMFF